VHLKAGYKGQLSLAFTLMMKGMTENDNNEQRQRRVKSNCAHVLYV